MARSFNGTSDFIQVDAAVTSPIWWNDAMGRAYAGWVNAPAGQSNVSFYGEGQSTSNSSFWFLGIVQASPATNLLRWSGSSQPGLSSTSVVADGTWHHVALVINSSDPLTSNDALLYVDGNLEASSINMPSVNTGSGVKNRAAFGCLPRSTTGNFFKGLLAHWAIWNRPLSAEEVRVLARGELPSRLTPMHYWPLTAPEAIIAQSLGKRRNHGTFAGSTFSADVPPLVGRP